MLLRTLTKTNGNGLTSVLNDYLEPWNEWLMDGFKGKTMSMPKVNITEDKANFNLCLVAPGLHKKDFKIDGRLLTMSSEKESDNEQNEETFTRREYNYSSFCRSFTLPDEVIADKINATYDGGVLKMVIPKTEKAKQETHKTVTVS